MTRTAQIESLGISPDPKGRPEGVGYEGCGLPKTQDRLRGGASIPRPEGSPRRGRLRGVRNSGGNHAYAEGYGDASDRR